MKFLAEFIMRGRSQATLVVTAAAALSVLVPLFGLVSSAAVALVTLRSGLRDGATIILLALVATGLLFAVALGSPLPALGLLLVLWAPVWGLSLVLRSTRSLSRMAQVAGIGGLLLVALVHVLVDDPASYWVQFLEPLRALLASDGAPEAQASVEVLARLAQWMTGAFVAALLLQLIAGVLIGRWWQAMLYNPGGFGEEFRAVRLPRAFGIPGALLLVGIAFQPGPGPIADFLIVLAPLLLLQGLAVVHHIHHARRAHLGWLVALYVLMVFFVPHVELILACLGLVDIWLDIRARVPARPGGQGNAD